MSECLSIVASINLLESNFLAKLNPALLSRFTLIWVPPYADLETLVPIPILSGPAKAISAGGSIPTPLQAVKSVKWSCEVCTYDNEASDTKCHVCTTAKSEMTPPADAAGGPGPGLGHDLRRRLLEVFIPVAEREFGLHIRVGANLRRLFDLMVISP